MDVCGWMGWMDGISLKCHVLQGRIPIPSLASAIVAVSPSIPIGMAWLHGRCPPPLPHFHCCSAHPLSLTKFQATSFVLATANPNPTEPAFCFACIIRCGLTWGVSSCVVLLFSHNNWMVFDPEVLWGAVGFQTQRPRYF